MGKKADVPGLSCANIKLRFNRNPVIGDKFASRAGQKGILSQKWPDINFPYCAATGMRPDLIINPHAFPSRMTIGMLIESLTSKGGALSGEFVDCSPFQKCDNDKDYGRNSHLDSCLHVYCGCGFSRGHALCLTLLSQLSVSLCVLQVSTLKIVSATCSTFMMFVSV